LTKEQKIQGNERAKAQKDFKDGLKQQKVDLQKKQKETKASKDDIKKQDKEYSNTAELHDMLFNQKQAQQKLHLDYNKKNQQAEETFLANKELMEKKHDLHKLHVIAQHKLNLAVIKDSEKDLKELFTQLHPLEIQHMQQFHVLDLELLGEKQTLELKQQLELLISEQKNCQIKFKQKTTTRNKRFRRKFEKKKLIRKTSKRHLKKNPNC